MATAVRRVGSETDPFVLLCQLGGLEHAALVGAVLSAAAKRVPVVLDGAITLSAALVAVALAPPLSEHLIASHAPAEPAGPIALAHLRLVPILDLQLRLGLYRRLSSLDTRPDIDARRHPAVQPRPRGPCPCSAGAGCGNR